MINKNFGITLLCGEVTSILDMDTEIAVTIKHRAKVDDTWKDVETVVEIIDINENKYTENFRNLKVAESTPERKTFLCIEMKERKDKNPIGRRFFYPNSEISFRSEDPETGDVKEAFYWFGRPHKDAEERIAKSSGKKYATVSVAIRVSRDEVKFRSLSFFAAKDGNGNPSTKKVDTALKNIKKGNLLLIKYSHPETEEKEWNGEMRTFHSGMGDNIEIVAFAEKDKE